LFYSKNKKVALNAKIGFLEGSPFINVITNTNKKGWFLVVTTIGDSLGRTNYL